MLGSRNRTRLIGFDNERKEFTVGANWFFNGHNKVTLDYSKLSIEDGAWPNPNRIIASACNGTYPSDARDLY